MVLSVDPPLRGGGAGRNDGFLDHHVARRSKQNRSVRAGRDAFGLPASGAGKGDASARDASGAGGRGHSYDGRLPGCAGASPGARAVLQRRVPGVHAGRAAHQSQDRGLRTGVRVVAGQATLARATT